MVYISERVTEALSSLGFPVASPTVHWKRKRPRKSKQLKSWDIILWFCWLPEGRDGEEAAERESAGAREGSEVNRVWDWEKERRALRDRVLEGIGSAPTSRDAMVGALEGAEKRG